MAIQYKLIMATSSICETVVDSASPHLQLTLKQDVAGFYNPYFNSPTEGLVLVDEIEVYYSGASSVLDFRLRGVTDDRGTVTITSVEHTTSDSFNSRASWTVSDDQIDWVFMDPPSDGNWASWTFNPSGNAPPVKVKVKLKRQDEPLPTCP